MGGHWPVSRAAGEADTEAGLTAGGTAQGDTEHEVWWGGQWDITGNGRSYTTGPKHIKRGIGNQLLVIRY